MCARVKLQLKERAEECALDAARMTLQCGSAIVRLTQAEYRLMKHLFHSASRWSSSEEMTKALQPAGRSPDLVRVLIHSVRRKLGVERWRLRHERQLGYRFEVAIRRWRRVACFRMRQPGARAKPFGRS
jgi:DNA-binding response OmpR family regulator